MGHGPCGLTADKASTRRTTVMRWSSTLQAGKRPLILDFRTACSEWRGDDVAAHIQAESDRDQMFQERPRPSVGPIQRSNVLRVPKIRSASPRLSNRTFRETRTTRASWLVTRIKTNLPQWFALPDRQIGPCSRWSRSSNIRIQKMGTHIKTPWHKRMSPQYHPSPQLTPTYFEHHALQQNRNEHQFRTPQAHPTRPSQHVQPPRHGPGNCS